MRYKVGDKVKIVKGIALLEGEIATIVKVYKRRRRYEIDLDDGDYSWYEDMFEEIEN